MSSVCCSCLQKSEQKINVKLFTMLTSSAPRIILDVGALMVVAPATARARNNLIAQWCRAGYRKPWVIVVILGLLIGVNPAPSIHHNKD